MTEKSLKDKMLDCRETLREFVSFAEGQSDAYLIPADMDIEKLRSAEEAVGKAFETVDALAQETIEERVCCLQTRVQRELDNARVLTQLAVYNFLQKVGDDDGKAFEEHGELCDRGFAVVKQGLDSEVQKLRAEYKNHSLRSLTQDVVGYANSLDSLSRALHSAGWPSEESQIPEKDDALRLLEIAVCGLTDVGVYLSEPSEGAQLPVCLDGAQRTFSLCDSEVRKWFENHPAPSLEQSSSFPEDAHKQSVIVAIVNTREAVTRVMENVAKRLQGCVRDHGLVSGRRPSNLTPKPLRIA